MTARNAFGDLATEATVAEIAARAGELASEVTQQTILDTLNGTLSPSGALTISGVRSKFRDNFARPVAQPDPDSWLFVNEAPDTGDGLGHIVNQGGDATGAAYLRISLSPFEAGTGVYLTSKSENELPIRVGWGITASQRIVGQEVFSGFVQKDDTDPLGMRRTPAPADLPITGSPTITSNVATLTVPNHGLKGGDRIVVVGNGSSVLDAGPIAVTIVDANTIQYSVTAANGTYTGGGVVKHVDPTGRAYNGVGLLQENGATTNVSFVTRRNGSKYRSTNSGTVATTPLQVNTNPYTDSWVANGVLEVFANIEEVSWRSYAADSNGGINGSGKYVQGNPDEGETYRLHVRARNAENFSRPIARVLSWAKTGSSTVTVTTDRPHGLSTASNVSVTGARDQTSFPASGGIAVLSVPTPTTFTVTTGGAATVTDTYGGVVWLNRGAVNNPGHISGAVQSITRSNNILSVVLSATVAGIAPGDYVNVWGMTGAALPYEDAYKVLRLTGTTLELDAPGPNFATINTGGSVIRRTDVRLHFARVIEHTRQLVEILGGRMTQDNNNAVPVATVNTVSANTYVRTAAVAGRPLSVTNLAANATSTQGTQDMSTDITGWRGGARYTVMHQAGTTHGYLIFDQSHDNVTWRETHRVPVPSDGAYHTFDFPPANQYYRARFLNGAVAQTAFFWSTVDYRGEPSRDISKNLLFPLTPVAGQALTASATFNSPTIDLGTNHQWTTFRSFFKSDQAGTAFLQQSMDGTTWYSTPATGSATVSAGGATVQEGQVVLRYVRCGFTNGATAATAFVGAVTLVSL